MTCGAELVMPETDGSWTCIIPKAAGLAFDATSRHRYSPRILENLGHSPTALMVSVDSD